MISTVTKAHAQQEILLLAMKAGQIQLENGAEIFRVEDTIMHICRAYGLHSVHIFVLSNGIFLSCGDETEPLFAKVLQVPVNNTNLRRVAEVNQLSRRIEEEGLSPENVRRELTRIEEHPGFPAALQIAVAGLAGACFGVMFGGSPWDFLCCRKPVSGLCRVSRQSAFGTDRAHHSRQCLDHLSLHPLLPLRPRRKF